MTQRHTSARTSRSQVPALHRALLKADLFGRRNGDIGGGKYDLATKALKRRCLNIVYDPFNRSEAHNHWALLQLHRGTDTVTVANVLNVIRERKARQEVIQLAVETSLTAYFTVYQGDRSGRGRLSRDGWQAHRRLKSYLPEIRQVFGDEVEIVTIAGLRVIATNP